MSFDAPFKALRVALCLNCAIQTNLPRLSSLNHRLLITETLSSSSSEKKEGDFGFVPPPLWEEESRDKSLANPARFEAAPG